MIEESSHEFGALNTLLLVFILGICILTAYLTKQYKIYYLPESAVAICVGLIVGGVVRLASSSSKELQFLSFEPELFFFLLLPPIIFEAAYSLKKKDFFSNFWTITIFSFAGTVISTFIVGYLVYLLGIWKIVDIDTSNPLEALLFGSLISAIDPVATLSVMGNADLHCNSLLYSLVFGESLLNDAVSIVLFKTFLGYYNSGHNFDGSSIPMFMVSFVGITLGSVFVGILAGLSCCYLCKHTNLKHHPDYEIGMLTLFAYGSYSLSEAMSLSGIMTIFFCGIVLSHYNIHNLSSTSTITAHTLFKSLGILAEFFVYLYIGMGVFTGKMHPWNFLFSFICFLFCVVARFFNIFPLSFLANFCRSEKIPLSMQAVMCFAGLRGAISFALSLNMPGEHRGLYVSSTLTIVLFTTLFCGGLTEPLLKLTKMNSNSPPPSPSYSPMENGIEMNFVETKNCPSPIHEDSRHLFTSFQRFDADIMRPWFGGSLDISTHDSNPDICRRRTTNSYEVISTA